MIPKQTHAQGVCNNVIYKMTALAGQKQRALEGETSRVTIYLSFAISLLT